MEHSPPPDSPILGKVVPPASVDYKDRELIFEHLFRKLAQFRNERLIYAVNEETETVSRQKSDVYDALLNAWCHVFVRNIWNACTLEGDPPKLAPLTETGTAGLPPLEEDKSLKKIINATLFLHLTTQKHYSALARAFTFSLGPNLRPAENAIAFTISNPDQALAEAEAKAKDEHAKQNQVFRKVGMGLGAAAGGLLIGVTGGLAAPLVGAGVGSILGFLGVGGTVAGVLATGLASSSVVCAALFGAYGAKSTREIVDRYTADVEDFRLIRMDRPQKGTDNLAVRICISGWLMAKDDVTEPWTIFNHGDRQEDTYALQWEVEALEGLSSSIADLMVAQAWKYLKGEILRRTVLAAFLSSLSPLAVLRYGKIIDNPWMKAKAKAIKTGRVLASLLLQRAFGNRPVTLIGYSLGGLVIFTALEVLASHPIKDTLHLIDSVFLFGLPVSTDRAMWSSIRRVVNGRLVNGYAEKDWVLGVIGRVTSDAGIKGLDIAGLCPVDVKGVENMACDVDGHLAWRGEIGKCLERLGVDVDAHAVQRQAKIGEQREEALKEAAAAEMEGEEAADAKPNGKGEKGEAVPNRYDAGSEKYKP